jgi:hypothetical protein
MFPNNSQSAILGAKDPLALILNPSFYSGSDVETCNVPGLPPPENVPEGCEFSGQAKAVPEPDVLGLFAAGALGLLLSGGGVARRHTSRSMRGRDRSLDQDRADRRDLGHGIS